MEKRERNQLIVNMLDTGKGTVTSLSTEFGLTKQRISQIYYKMTGHYANFIRKRKRKVTELENKKKCKQIKFECISCGKGVSFKEGHHLSKYCRKCHNLNKNGQRNFKIFLACDNCGKEYHPFRSKKKNLGKNFCKVKCYLEDRRKSANAHQVEN